MNHLHRRLRDVFTQNSERVAIDGKNYVLTYGELLGFALNLHQQLISVTNGCHSSVGILSTRREESYVAVLACFFSGIKFVPLNPELPTSRLKQIAESGNIDVIACDDSSDEIAQTLNLPMIKIDFLASPSLDADKQFLDEPLAKPEAIAYQMFTSGSTGQPKGVPISYASLSHYVIELRKLLALPDGLRFSQTFDLSFDLAMHDIFVALCSVGTIVPASKLDLMMPHAYIQKREIDVWFSVPMLAALAQRGQNDKPVTHKMKIAMFCGEPLASDYAGNFLSFLDSSAPLYNLYGPTEATIAFTYKRFNTELEEFPVVPIGFGFGQNKVAIETIHGVYPLPVEGTEAISFDYLLEGELLLAGPQVFAGYEPANGTEIFIHHEAQKYYRSGDLVRFESNELHHLGRKDSQIKLRGYRIELGDIEASFRLQFNCSVAVAVLIGEGTERELAIAYEAPVEIEDYTPLQTILPDYMTPSKYRWVEKIPTNINGKIDRKAVQNFPQW